MSRVDESLFGTRTIGRNGRKTMGTMRKQELSTSVISRADLAAIRGRMVIQRPEDAQAARDEMEATRHAKAAQAKARKERMLKMAAEAKSKSKKSDLEEMADDRHNAIARMADQKKDENHDLVKLLNTLAARAAAFTIRDRQIEEKEYREAHSGDYDKRMDMLMEIDRLQDLKKRQEDEDYRRVKRVEDRSVIIEQIKARQQTKVLEREARQQENDAMLALIDRYAAEDQAAQKRHQEEVKVARVEVRTANDAAILRKQAAKQREKDEEDAVLIYQAKKDEDMRLREIEENEKAERAKETQARLLASQEKIMSKQGEIDELRARRYAEARERQARARELGDAQLLRERTHEQQVAREAQAEQRKSMMAREAVMQQQEYEDAVQHALTVMERERLEVERKAGVSKKHRAVLQEQIETAQARRKAAGQVKYEEGRQLKQEFAAERAKLENIRSKMVEDMRKKGINPQYLSEMMGADIQALQMR